MTFRAAMLLAFCIGSETCEQLLYRASGDRKGAVRYFGFLSPAIAIHVIRIGVWLTLLKYMRLGVALPLMGANYATIALGGWLVFGEKVDRRRMIGIGLVMLGFALVASSAMGGD